MIPVSKSRISGGLSNQKPKHGGVGQGEGVRQYVTNGTCVRKNPPITMKEGRSHHNFFLRSDFSESLATYFTPALN
jgi:hypothetical protein